MNQQQVSDLVTRSGFLFSAIYSASDFDEQDVECVVEHTLYAVPKTSITSFAPASSRRSSKRSNEFPAPPLYAAPTSVLAPLLCGSMRRNLLVLYKCLLPMRLIVGEPSSSSSTTTGMSLAKWKRGRVDELAKVCSVDGACDAGDFVESCVLDANLQSLLLAALLLLESSRDFSCAIKPETGKYLDQIMGTNEQVAVLILEKICEHCSQFVATVSNSGDAKRTELPFAPSRAFKAHPMTFLLLHALLTVSSTTQRAFDSVCRILALQFWYLECCEVDREKVGLGASAQQQQCNEAPVSLHAQMNAAGIGKEICTLLYEAAFAGSRGNECVMAWTAGLALLYPSAEERASLFDQLLGQSIASPEANGVKMLLESLCFKISTSPAFAPQLLSSRPALEMCNRLLDSIHACPAPYTTTIQEEEPEVVASQSAAAVAVMPDEPPVLLSTLNFQPHPNPPVSPVSSLGGQSAFSTQRHESDEEDDRYSVSSLTGNKARSVSSMTSSVFALDSDFSHRTESNLTASHHQVSFRLAKPKHMHTRYRTRLYSAYFLLAMHTADPAISAAAGSNAATVLLAKSMLIFDEPRVAETIQVLDQGRKAVQNGDKKWGTALSQINCSTTTNVNHEGLFRWKIKVNKCDDGHVFFGVATRDAISSGFLGEDAHGWGFLGKANLWHSREKKQSHYGEPIRTGDTLTITFDAKHGNLSFANQRKDFGIAFRNLPRDVYPAVALYERGDSVTLMLEDDSAISNGGAEADVCRMFWSVPDGLPLLERKLSLANYFFSSLKECSTPAPEFLFHVKRLLPIAAATTSFLGPLASLCLWPQEKLTPEFALELLPQVFEVLPCSASAAAAPQAVDFTGTWLFSDSTSKHHVELQSGQGEGEVKGYLQSKREGQVRISGHFHASTNVLELTEHWKTFVRRVEVQLVSIGLAGLGWCRIESKAQPTQQTKSIYCVRVNNRRRGAIAIDMLDVFTSLVGKLVLCLTAPPPSPQDQGKWVKSPVFQHFPVQHSLHQQWLQASFLKQMCNTELEAFTSPASVGSKSDEFTARLLRGECKELDHYMLRFAGQAALAAIGGEVMANLRRHVIATLLVHASPRGILFAQELDVQFSLQHTATTSPTGLVERGQRKSAVTAATARCCDDQGDEDCLEEPTELVTVLEVQSPPKPEKQVAATAVSETPNPHLITIWKAANRVVSWVVRERQQDGMQTYEDIVQPVLARVKFLMRCSSSDGDDEGNEVESLVSFILDSTVAVPKQLQELEAAWTERANCALLKCVGLKAFGAALDRLPQQHHKSMLLAWLDCNALQQHQSSSAFLAPKSTAAPLLTKLDFKDAGLLDKTALPAPTCTGQVSHCLVGFENCGEVMSRELCSNFEKLFARLVAELSNDSLQHHEYDRERLLQATLFPVNNLWDCNLIRLAVPQWKQNRAFAQMSSLAKQLVTVPHSFDLLHDLYAFFLQLANDELFSQAIQLVFDLFVMHPSSAELVATWEWTNALLSYCSKPHVGDSARSCHAALRLVFAHILALPAQLQAVQQLFTHVKQYYAGNADATLLKPLSGLLASESVLILQAMFMNEQWRDLVEGELERRLACEEEENAAAERFAAVSVLGGFSEPFRFAAKVSRTRNNKCEYGLVSQVIGEQIEVVFLVDEEDESSGTMGELHTPVLLDKADLYVAPCKLLTGLSVKCVDSLLQVFDQVVVEEEDVDLSLLRVGIARLLPSILKSSNASRLHTICQLAVQSTETMGTVKDEHLAALYFQSLGQALAKSKAPTTTTTTQAVANEPVLSVATPTLEENPALEELMNLDMGFPRELCRVALDHSQNDIEQAIHFCLEHANNAEQIVEEYRLSRARNGAGGHAAAADAVVVEKLAEMGFPRTWCIKGLEQVTAGGGARSGDTQSTFNQALAWILSNGDALQEEDMAAAAAPSNDTASTPSSTPEAHEQIIPPPIKLQVNSGGSHSTRFTAQSDGTLAVSCAPFNKQNEGGGTFPTVTSHGVLLQKGKWYYEVTLQTESCMQIGWCDAMFTGDAFEGNGTGDCTHSWSYDGYRKLKWHNAQQQAWGRQWRTGQVAGCFADLDTGELWFSLDGNWGEGMGLGFRGLRKDKSYIRGLQPSISFNRSERFKVNFGPDFKFACSPPHISADSVLPVSAVVTLGGDEYNARFDREDDCFEELVGDSLSDRYFVSGQVEQQPQQLVMMRRSSVSNAAALTAMASAATGGTLHTSTTPPLPLNPASKDFPFPQQCSLRKQNISSLNQASEELHHASKEDIDSAISRTSWALFTLRARQALVPHLHRLVELDEDNGALVWKLVRILLGTMRSSSEEDFAAQVLIDRFKPELVELVRQELALIAKREYANIPWDEPTCSVLVVHTIWSMVADDFTFAVNEKKLGLHPSLQFALWATERVLEYSPNDRSVFIELWTLVLQSPGTRLKLVAARVLIELLQCEQDLQVFDRVFGERARVKQMAARLVARGGVFSLQAMHSRYAMALCQLAAALEAAQEL